MEATRLGVDASEIAAQGGGAGEPAPFPAPGAAGATLVRRLGTPDAVLITIGSVIGTGIFLTTADMARVLPHAGLILLVWVAGGLLVLAGALTVAEMGALFPRAGGLYQFLREAYGPLPGFLYGWVAFLVINSGGIAALALGFGEYLGSFVPFFSTGHVLVALGPAPVRWTLNGGQLAGVLAIALLTVVNVRGVREGAGVQNLLTGLKIAALAALVGFGLLAPAGEAVVPQLTVTPPSRGLLAAFGVAMIAALWTYDGWYGVTFLAGEMRQPARALPRGLILGTLTVLVFYVLVNLVYVRALPPTAMGESGRIAESAAAALFGPRGARLVSLAVLVSIFGCLSATVLYCARLYLAMARDGLFFRSVAAVHPRHRTPHVSLWLQGGWSVLLAVSGTYEELYTYVVFAVVLFQVALGVGVFVLRATRPGLPRPYRTWGYPVVPALFVLGSLTLAANTLLERPTQSLLGLTFLALGVPAYLAWRRRAPIAAPAEEPVGSAAEESRTVTRRVAATSG